MKYYWYVNKYDPDKWWLTGKNMEKKSKYAVILIEMFYSITAYMQ